MSQWQAGWYGDYLDSSAPGTRRYWNGEAWTEYRVDADGVPISAHGKRRKKLPKWSIAPEVGRALLTSVFRDRWVILVLAVGSLVSMALAGLVSLPLYWSAPAPGELGHDVVRSAALAVGIGITVTVTQLFVATVVAAALIRADGGHPTLRSALALVWSRRRQLLAWALVSALLMMVLRLLERLGIGGLVAGLLGELAWSVATLFALPVIVVEGTMPIATVKRSARLFADNFGFAITYSAGFGLLATAVALPLVIAGAGIGIVALITLFTASAWTTQLGAAAVLALVLLGFVLLGAVSSALGQYLNFSMFRLATDESVPGLDPSLLPPRLPGPATA